MNKRKLQDCEGFVKPLCVGNKKACPDRASQPQPQPQPTAKQREKTERRKRSQSTNCVSQYLRCEVLCINDLTEPESLFHVSGGGSDSCLLFLRHTEHSTNIEICNLGNGKVLVGKMPIPRGVFLGLKEGDVVSLSSGEPRLLVKKDSVWLLRDARCSSLPYSIVEKKICNVIFK